MNRYGRVLLGLGLLVATLSAGRDWVRFTVRDPVLGLQAREATGYALAPALSACGLMALAAVLVLLLTRRRARVSGLVVLAVSAAWATWLVADVMLDPVAAAEASLADPAVRGATAEVLRGGATAWPWIFAAAVVVVLIGITWVAWSWWGQSRTRVAHRPPEAATSRPTAPSPPLSDVERARRDNHDAWDDLSDGKDPTD
ncbi:MAG: Trp biosynthesis-associated membrane protein [Ornithinimicrobium sp.]